MIDFSWSHILIVVIVALVVIGPKDLPKFMHMAGRWMGKARAMADQFRKSFDEMSRQAELDELRAEINSLRSERPLSGIGDHQNILPTDMTAKPASDPQPPMTAAPPSHDASAAEFPTEPLGVDAGHIPPQP